MVVLLKKCEMVEDEELVEVVEMEVGEVVCDYELGGEDVGVMKGCAVKGVEGDGD
ncbi:hypothetical protein [Bacillus pumilus]|uniref:hypothetical protein n=1 Tax=Bacillus pumilus TaxID=1408 RepID=UPI001642F273|nr:hypothetical protein [Bacillus pumilus]